MAGRLRPGSSAVPRHCATALLLVSAAVAFGGQGVTATGSEPAERSAVLVNFDSSARDSLAGQVARDAVRDDQWHLKALRAADAWRISTGSGVTVAVIDSGVSGGHPDLIGQVLPGLDLVSSGGNGQQDAVGHGTTVAALIAGRADDQRGVVGLAPDSKILPVRVLDAQNSYQDARTVAEGVRWAVDNEADVINLSLGGGVGSEALAEAIDYAFQRNVVVVACVGNVSGDGAATEIWYPAREPGVLAVGAIGKGSDHPLWRGSLTGEQTVLTAPGTDITGARGKGYWQVQGTSFAAPLVTATAALIRARWPEMSAANVVERLIRTARDLGASGRDGSYGYGLVDPVAALTATVSPVATNQLDTVPPPGRSGFGRAPGSQPRHADIPRAQIIALPEPFRPRTATTL
jgi:type VII secretion-associated serine protease mycosin